MADAIIYNCIWIKHAPIRSIGAHQIADWLRKWGYSIKVIDFCNFMTTDELYQLTIKHLDKNTKFIGVNSTFWAEVLYTTANFDIHGKPTTIEPQWIVNLRERLSSYKIDWVLGGVYANFPSNLFKYQWLCFSGFAEDSILQYMEERTNKTRKVELFDIVTQQSRFTLDCSIKNTEVLPIELSRGCQFKCTFCRYPLLGKKKGTYIRNMQCVKEEFLYNYYNFGTTKYFFMDDTVNESDEKISELADIVNKLPFKLSWVGYNRLDLIGSRRHSIDTLKESGLVSSYFGIESFHPTASKIIGKGWNGIRAKDFLLELKESWGTDINFYLQFMIGLTGETENDIDQTEEWCIKNQMPDWGYNALSIKLGNENFYWRSEFDNNYRMYGYTFESNNYYEWRNKEWTFSKALEKSRNLSNKRVEKYPSCWLLGELSTHGADLKELMQIKKSDIDFQDLHIKSKIFVKNYVTEQLK